MLGSDVGVAEPIADPRTGSGGWMSTIRALIDTQADLNADRVFVISPETEEQLTYCELRTTARALGTKLDELRVEKGAKVAFMLDNGLWTATLFLGVMYSGRIIVPLNAVAGQSQLEYVLVHCDCEVLFVSDRYLDKLRPAIDRLSRPLRVIRTSETKGLEWPQMEPVGEAEIKVTAEDIALLIYTSGTTGKPKGVLLSQANVIAGGSNTMIAHQLTADDRALCVLPLYHINAEMVTVIAPLIGGGSVVMPNRFSASAFWETVAKHQCTWFSVVPTIISYLLDQADREHPGVVEGTRLRQLRFGRSASAALPPRRAFCRMACHLETFLDLLDR